MAWKTLSLHFQQTFEGGYRYLDNCGEFLLAAEEKLNFLMNEATPTGAKLEIPEQGVHASCDSASLTVAQELPIEAEAGYFLRLCEGLAGLVAEHFRPKGVFRNGMLWKSYKTYPDIPSVLSASLAVGGDFHQTLSKAVEMVPESKTTDCFFVSGSSTLHVNLQPVTFDRLGLSKRNVPFRANRAQSGRIDRLNKFAERGVETPHALVLDVDLMENDPPKPTSLEAHFSELQKKTNQLRKAFGSI